MTDSTVNDAGEVTSDSISDTLKQRGTRYGDFAHQASISQALKNGIMQHYFAVHGGNNAEPLPPYMVEAISMICHKLGRIANGDPYYDDSWRDIAGFSQLVVDELNKSTKE